jgi:EAL domain-containing protein (putative c-di-GMP-specific phosphodiesterase class I)
MDATEPRTHTHGPSARTADLLRELAHCDSDADATRLVLNRAAEATGAELSVYADGDLIESTVPEATLVVPVHGRLRGNLVLARAARPFDAEERTEALAIARALSLYEPGLLGPELRERLVLQDELAAGLARGQIQAYFLPVADLRTARVTGIEALARWIHPERGLLLPKDFLGLAESGGLMAPLTERILELAIQAAGDWWRSGLRLELSLNLPAAALTEFGPRLREIIPAALSRSGLSPETLRLDIPEDTVMSASDPAGALAALADLGVSLSIDDFGTGHTSLGRLKGLPVDELKIDRIFIRALARGGEKALVRSTIHLARQMGLRVVAEGVDTEDGWRQLRGMGCDAAQGFLIGAPMPARDFLAWVVSWNGRGSELNTIPRDPLEVAKQPGRKGPHARDTAPA